MSEFYEIMTPDLFLLLQRENIFPLECMICYEECNMSNPIVMLPCFHILHEECAKKTIEMSFRNAIHPNTILCTWEFHCPQKDSIDSLSEQGRVIYDILCRNSIPSIPRCLHIPIPNRDVQTISYFTIPYVQQWYQQHTPKKDNTSMVVVIVAIAFVIIAIVIGMVILTPLLRILLLCYIMYQMYHFMLYHMELVQTCLQIMLVCVCVAQMIQ